MSDAGSILYMLAVSNILHTALAGLLLLQHPIRTGFEVWVDQCELRGYGIEMCE